VRVVPLEGAPRVVRTLTTNLSRRGLFVQATEPLPLGTKVAVSLEAGGQTLPFAEAEVVWTRPEHEGPSKGFGVRFDRFLHPNGKELVDYLVDNLDRGRPLVARRRRWRARWLAVGAALVGTAGTLALVRAGLALASPAVSTGAPPVAEVAQVASPDAPAEASQLASSVEEFAPAHEVVLGAPTPGETRGQVLIPSGAAGSLSWAMADRELRLSVAVRSGHFRRAFLLAGPPRAVFDLEGAAPERSYVLAGTNPFVRRVRVGRQAESTRVVVDLTRWPADTTDDGQALILSF
jgi:hypothetical protein